MLFHSFLFVAFFACIWLVTVSLPQRWRNLFLLAASYVFYAAWSWKFLILLVASTLLDYVAGRAIGASQSARVRRAWLALSVVGHLGVLCFFKYYDFFIDALDALLLPLGVSVAGLHLHLIFPLGLSFYTLQTLGYTIDVYRGHFRPVHELVDFSLFVGFFPQILAGPIARAPQLVPQVRARRRIDAVALREGAYLCLWGFFKKVVLADNLARIVDPVFASGASPDGIEVVVATLGFTILAYADFSGYTDIARGTARMLGFELLRNFDTPIPLARHGRVVASLAHELELLAARLPVSLARRGPRGAAAPDLQPVADPVRGRTVARLDGQLRALRDVSRDPGGGDLLVSSRASRCAPRACAGRRCSGRSCCLPSAWSPSAPTMGGMPSASTARSSRACIGTRRSGVRSLSSRSARCRSS